MILDGNLWTANVGDSRTVLDNDGIAVQLTEDAKPEEPRYTKRLKNEADVSIFHLMIMKR